MRDSIGDNNDQFQNEAMYTNCTCLVPQILRLPTDITLTIQVPYYSWLSLLALSTWGTVLVTTTTSLKTRLCIQIILVPRILRLPTDLILTIQVLYYSRLSLLALSTWGTVLVTTTSSLKTKLCIQIILVPRILRLPTDLILSIQVLYYSWLSLLALSTWGTVLVTTTTSLKMRLCIQIILVPRILRLPTDLILKIQVLYYSRLSLLALSTWGTVLVTTTSSLKTRLCIQIILVSRILRLPTDVILTMQVLYYSRLSLLALSTWGTVFVTTTTSLKTRLFIQIILTTNSTSTYRHNTYNTSTILFST